MVGKGIRTPFFLLVVFALSVPAYAQVTHCDSGVDNCRNELVRLIDNETVGIDGAQWIHRDTTVVSALIRAHRRGVLVRMLVDLSTEENHEGVTAVVNTMRDAGIPVQAKTSGGGILHWKIYLFHGQGVVKWGAANSTPSDLIPDIPYKSYRNETNIFDARPTDVQSFITKFEDAWVSANFTNYGNVPATLKVRAHPRFTIDTKRLVFVPGGGLKSRLLDLINREPTMIDLSVLRLGDQQITDALINAFRRGVEMRINSEQAEYRDTLRYLHAHALDQLYAAGIRPRWRAHSGQNHEKTIVFHGLNVLWTGSSNLTASSLGSNMEHNLFSTDAEEIAWYKNRLARRWFNSQFVDGVQMIESKPFSPSGPGPATSLSPVNGFIGTPTLISFNGGFYGITADVYFGTNPNPPLYLAGIPLGVNIKRPVALPPLGTGTTYYWKVVTRTHANKTSSTAVLSFSTPGAPGPPPPSTATDVVLWASQARLAGAWRVEADPTAAGGALVRHPDAAAGRVTTPLASPTNYFELTFEAQANVPYHFWLRGRADKNYFGNDSVYVQFSNVPVYAIGTTKAMAVTLEDCTGCGVSGWGWQDDAANSFAGPFMFTTSGVQTVRIQTREDGLAIDQIIIAGSKFLNVAPGAVKGDTNVYPATTTGGGGGGDTTAPDVMLTAPASGITVTGSVSLIAAASDNVGVSKVEFLVNGAVISTDNTAPYEATWNSSTVANGLATLTARATDAAGNPGTSTPVTVTVSNTAPSSTEEIVLYAADQGQILGGWTVTADATAAGGARLQNANAGAAKLATALASPTQAFEITFNADAGRGYRIWLRGKAQGDVWPNDSVYVQFDGSVTSTGVPVWRIGTTDATAVQIEDCDACGLQAWGWADNAYGLNKLGPLVYFAQSGPQRVRIQVREDGLGLDQIVLSSVRYLTTSPGAMKNDTTILPR